jgi:hypothetical protein
VAAAARHRSTWLCAAALAAIDIGTRADFLAPRLLTLRGGLNYAGALVVLWIVVRLLAVIAHPLRVPVFALVVAFPMAVEWAMFRSYRQFVEPTDFVALWEAPGVVLGAASLGADRVGVVAVFAASLACAWLLPREARPLRRRPAAAAVVVGLALLVTGATYWRASPCLAHSGPAFGSAMVSLVKRAGPQQRKGRRVAISAPPTSERLPNIVLVIGESLAASHLTIYGYERDTSPRLQQLFERGKIVAFRQATVMGPTTRASVPYILTGLVGPDPAGRVLDAPTVLEYAKARGYHTAFVSAQEESWGGLDALYRRGADSFRSGIDFAPKVDVMKGSDDLVVLEQGLVPTLRTMSEPFFVIAHMDGSHLPYGHHAPATHKVFPEDGINSIGAYDNTIRVTDEYLARVLDVVRARDPQSWMFFTSDHGQPLGEGGAFFNRGYQSNVVRDPLLVFPPDEASRAFFAALADQPTSACDLTPTILHLMRMTPSPDAPMDCVDLFELPPARRVRVVSAYTPASVNEPTVLVLSPDGERALYDLERGTVTLDDGSVSPIADRPPPAEVLARLE